MAKEMMKRFQDAYDYLYHNGSINSKTDLAKIMGAGRTSISYAYNGRPEYLNEKFLIKFSNAFPGVFNIDWLLTGDGEMLKKAQEDTKSNGVTNSSDENISRLLEQNKELIDVLKKSLEAGCFLQQSRYWRNMTTSCHIWTTLTTTGISRG